MKPQTIVLLFFANGFVSFYFWSQYRHGMPARVARLDLLFSLIGVSLAVVLGRMLAERGTRGKRRR